MTAPGDFAQVEAPQLVTVDGRLRAARLVPGRGPLPASGSRGSGRRVRPERSSSPQTRCSGPTPHPAAPIAAPDGPLGTLYAGKLVDARARRPGQFMAFRGNGDRDFIGELTDPLPVTVEPDGQLLVEYPPHPRRSRTMTLAPEVQSLLDWGAEPRREHRRAAAARAPPRDPRRARPRAPTPGASSSSPLPRRRRSGSPVDGRRDPCPSAVSGRRRPASGVRSLPRWRLRPRHDRLPRQRGEMRAHLPRRRLCRGHGRVPARARASVPDRRRRLLRGAPLDGCATLQASGSTRTVSPSAASPPAGTSRRSSRSWRATAAGRSSRCSCSKFP